MSFLSATKPSENDVYPNKFSNSVFHDTEKEKHIDFCVVPLKYVSNLSTLAGATPSTAFGTTIQVPYFATAVRNLL